MKRIIRLTFEKRTKLLVCFILIFIITYFGGRMLSRPSEDEVMLQELMLRDPSLLGQKIQELKRQVRDLTALLNAGGIAVPLEDSESLPTIYVITPTYARPTQFAELNRLRAVFLHVPRLWWVVVEDANQRSRALSDFLSSSGVPYSHLAHPTPEEMKLGDKDARWRQPRGVLQRNAGLAWLRQNCVASTPAVTYFADDDNSYSIELFREMRWTKKVSVWPVGLVGGVMVERPLCLCKQGDSDPPQVTDWLVGWRPDRQFPIDMAGFAVSVPLLLSRPAVQFSVDSAIGHLENDFLEKLVTRDDLEPKADCCTKVLVWHMNAKKPKLTDEARLRGLGRRTDAGITV